MKLRTAKEKPENMSEKEMRIKVCKEIIDGLIISDSNLLYSSLKDEKRRHLLENKIDRILQDRRNKGREYIEKKDVIEYIDKLLSGYGAVDALIDNKEISDIKIYSYDHIRIKKYGRRSSYDTAFDSPDDYRRFTNLVAIKNEVPLSDLNAIQTFTDKESSDDFILRVNISTGLVNSTGAPYVQIRKIPKHKYTMDELVQHGMMDSLTRDYLIKAAKESSGILFCGKGASGKTTLMNAMLEHIPYDKSALVIQENEELFSNEHPDMMFQHIVTGRGEGRISYSLEDLARNGLLIDLDYFIIGEIKGREAAHFMMANFTGHQSWTSVHGNSAAESVYKLADYIKQATDYTLSDAMKMLSGISTIVFMKNFKVWEVATTTGFHNGELGSVNIITYDTESNKWRKEPDR